MSEPMPIIERVRQYVEQHALCSRAQIAKELGIGGGTASDCLSRLRELGEIRGWHSGIINDPVLWKIGEEDGFAAIERQLGAPIRVIVSSWTPHMRRDPLVSAFFGN